MRSSVVEPTLWLQAIFGIEAKPLFDLFSDWGGPLGWALCLLIAFYAFGTRAGSQLALVAVSAGLTNTWLKWWFFEPRPYFVSDLISALKATPGLGMPSGHAEGVAAVGACIAAAYPRRWVILTVVVVVLMTGISRVYYGVHSVGQVLAGWLLGLTVAGIGVWITPRVKVWWQQPTHRWGLVVAALVPAALITAWLLDLRGAQAVPAEWSVRYAATTTQLGEAATALVLVDVGNVVLLGLLAGFVGVAGFCRPVEVRDPLRALANVVVGVAALAGFYGLAAWFGAEGTWWILLVGLAFPWSCLWGPMALVERFDLQRIAVRRSRAG